MPKGLRTQLRFLAFFLLAQVALVGGLHAQTAGASLAGRIVDASGAAVPGVTVTAMAPATGLTRSVTSGGDGTYRFAALPVGIYDVKAALSSFKTAEQKGVALNVATVSKVDFTLQIASVSETVTVTAQATLVTPEATIGSVISQTQLETLPLNGRQFANLGILAPGTSLAYNSDPTKPGQLTIALNGGIGRNVNSIVDGGDNTDDTIGGALQNFSVDSVEQFNIQTQQYKAEYGRSTGGVLTVVTKSGTNTPHGTLFSFFRTKGLNSATTTEEANGGVKQDYSRQQFGASFGGPIVKDKAHFFGTYERTARATNYTVATKGLFPSLDGSAVATPFHDSLASFKITYNASSEHFLQARFGYQKNDDKLADSAPAMTPNALGTLGNKFYSILLGHQWQIGSGSLNEFTFQYTDFTNSIAQDTNDAVLIFPNGTVSGQNQNTPQSTFQTKYQFKNDFSFSSDMGGHRHDFKLGVNYVHEPTLGGDGGFLAATPAFELLEDRVGSPVGRISVQGGQALYNTPVDQYSIYFQDDWRASDRLTLNLGLRYDLWTGFDLDQTSNAIWKTLSTQTTFNESYLKDFQGGKGGVLENDKNNFGPRLGFSYDMNGNGKTFLRGGWGIYYDFPYTNATILFPALSVQTNYGAVYEYTATGGIRNPDGSFFQPGQALPPNQIAGLGESTPNEIASPTLRTPFSRQASLGVSAEVNDWLGMSIDLTTVDYRAIPYRFRANPFTAAGTRRFPQFGSFRVWYGNGEADYDGFNLMLRAKMTDKLTAQGFYTLSRARGNVLAGADEFRITDRDYQPDLNAVRDQTVNPLDPQCAACFGPLNTDARHRITLSATYMVGSGFTASGLVRYRSATPYTVWAGKDLNGDRYNFDLAPGVAEVNSARGHAFTQFDLRIAKEFKFSDMGIELLFEVFNLFNAENPAGFIGNKNASNFGQPTKFAGDPGQGEQRLAQFGARFKF